MSNAWYSAVAGMCRIGSVMALLACISAETLAQSAEGYEVRLLQPGNSTFDSLLQKTPSKHPVPQIARSARLQGALLINDSAHPIVAFTLRWRVTHKDGSISESYRSLTSEPERGGGITGLKPVLQSGQQVFITPGNQWTTDLGQVPLVSAVPFGVAPGEAVSAALDCVVFADGTISGPNKSQLLERLSIERRAQVEETEFIARLIAEGKSDDAIRRTLEGHIQRGRAAGDETRQDWHAAARGRQALRMAIVLQGGGRDRLQSFTSKVAQLRSRIEGKVSTL